MDCVHVSAWTFLGLAVGLLVLPRAVALETAATSEAARLETARMMAEYFEEMCIPKPFEPRRGEDFEKHRAEIREQLLYSIGLLPLPERPPLDVHLSEPLDQEWCTVRRVYYQLWPGVYTHGLLYMPKTLEEKPAPAMLCPAGHFPDSNLYKGEQARALYFAKMGYVVFAPFQSHYEDMSLGICHQTLLVWQNMRAIDFLVTLPEVDAKRIGSAGCSGGGYQTAMMLALDPRVIVGADVGYSEEYRSILFPHTNHCVCNHIPWVMRYTDQTEISALGMPKPVQYMVMNDQTRYFPYSIYPKVQDLYRINGASGRTDVAYFDTPHDYARPKRERTYWWMEKWLRGRESDEFPQEPEDLEDHGTWPVPTFEKLTLPIPGNQGLHAISDYYRDRFYFKAPEISDRSAWEKYRERMRATLSQLLGEAAQLPARHDAPGKTSSGDSSIEVRFPSEAGLMLPATVLPPRNAKKRVPIVIMCSGDGRSALLQSDGPDSPRALAAKGNLVVVVDPRFTGELDWRQYQQLFATKAEGEKILTYEHIRYLDSVGDRAWERNSIVWGRPLQGMIATDLSAVLSGVLSHPVGVARDAIDAGDVTLVARDSGDLGVAAIFAAALDPRIGRVDADLSNCCFARTETFSGWWLAPGYDPSLRPSGLSIVPFILRHGDVLQWAALLADRKVALRNLSAEAGDPAWLTGVFAAAGNPRGVSIQKAVPPSGKLVNVEQAQDGAVHVFWKPGLAPGDAPKVVKFRKGWGLRFDAAKQTQVALGDLPGADFWAKRGPLTVQLVVQPDRLAQPEAALFSKWIPSDGRRSVFLGLNNRGQVFWCVSATGRADDRRKQVDSTPRLEVGKCYAIAAVFDPGKRMALYINGRLAAELTQSVPDAVWFCDTPVVVGARPGQTYADATMGDLWIAPRALDGEAIRRWAEGLSLDETTWPAAAGWTEWRRAVLDPARKLPPVRALTHGPKPHWFGYYDKFQTDPTDRYVLSMEADFDLRVPTPENVARIGMIDTADGDKWIPLAETRAWNFQQGCMLQWRPGSDREILYNDRDGDHFVCRVLDIKTVKTRTLPRAIDQVHPDGKVATCQDYARMGAMRTVIGYAVDDVEKYRRVPAPDDSGIWLMDLDSGESRLIVSVAQAAKIPYPGQKATDRLYIAHTQWSPDGKRFLFFNRGDTIDSRLLTAAMDGSDLRRLTYQASHYDWFDPAHVLIEIPKRGGFFLFKDDGSMQSEKLLAAPPGHQSYLPGNRWLLSDTTPMGPDRIQHVYLVHLADRRIVPIGHFPQPPAYTGDVRCDNHPRQSRDGTRIIIDSAHGDGRQMYMIDIRGIVGGNVPG